MPNIKSAAKRQRQNAVRRARNRSAKSELRTCSKKVLDAAQAGQFEQAESAFRIAAKKLDQASAKGMLHKNAASRRKSRLHHAIVGAKAKKASS